MGVQNIYVQKCLTASLMILLLIFIRWVASCTKLCVDFPLIFRKIENEWHEVLSRANSSFPLAQANILNHWSFLSLIKTPTEDPKVLNTLNLINSLKNLTGLKFSKENWSPLGFPLLINAISTLDSLIFQLMNQCLAMIKTREETTDEKVFT